MHRLPRHNNMSVVSFFAGCGGLDLGFEQAGFRVVWANEFEPHCRSTYIRNHPQTIFVLGDICKIDPDLIPDCDGFIGGPPCQSWSVGGKQKGLDDERGQLFLKYIELVKVKKPKFFVIENVKGMLDDKFKNVFEDFVNKLDSAGYDVQWALLDAVNYRIPQNRERVFFVGFKKELDIIFNFPSPTCVDPITLEQAIGDITEEPNRFSAGKMKDSDKRVDENNQYPNHDVLTSKFGSFYYRGNRRRGWQQPSFTINATAEFVPLHPSSPKMIYYGHENWNFQKDKLEEYRRLSVRECARIQTFPDSFIFDYNNIKDAYKMIGNAVPPRLGNEIAKSIQNAFNHLEVSTTVQKHTEEQTSVLVGYYKGDWHKRLILTNMLYYVRSDGRKGSIFKQDCSMTPKYLLLHHGDKADIFELDAEEPVLATGDFLKTLGFDSNGEMYLCFHLKNSKSRTIKELGGNIPSPNYNRDYYAPYFTTLEKIIC